MSLLTDFIECCETEREQLHRQIKALEASGRRDQAEPLKQEAAELDRIIARPAPGFAH